MPKITITLTKIDHWHVKLDGVIVGWVRRKKYDERFRAPSYTFVPEHDVDEARGMTFFSTTSMKDLRDQLRKMTAKV